jgi:hypothetical protein
MPALGLSDQHLRDAMAEIARHLLALGARLVYGGDLRAHGFSELLFELVARHGRDADATDRGAAVTNYLAWPVHIRQDVKDLERASADLEETAELIYLTVHGELLTPSSRKKLRRREPSEAEWAQGLSAMRHRMQRETSARIVLGGRVDQYRGAMPGIAEEALTSLAAKQPLFLMGGFGGCASDIASMLGLASLLPSNRASWQGRALFEVFTSADLHNGLLEEENATLARTPHVDQAVALILRGLLRLIDSTSSSF